MAIGDNLLHTMSSLMETCKKHVSHATRRLRSHASLSKLGGKRGFFLSRRTSFEPSLGNGRVAESDEGERSKEEDEEEEGVWRRTILMGEKCQPLDFSGAIHYDSSGRQVSTPRTPLRTPLTSFAFHDEDEEEEEVLGREHDAHL
ncbi:hypothetical protein Cni_G08636 [Canna indica]|uniref:Uncharacterized protein n=1 Tax=Canna indica TaxID=4628 RepID=A0AAQ3Q8V9_9LILI|nr:hypothetical protein Cni_G08636 [Canna indica]